MEAVEQKTGERQVRERLIDPLLKRGLSKPGGLTKDAFEAMLEDLCQRLAYMEPLNLDALAEQVAANPAGKERDRLPIANRILEWAGQIQPPSDDASPLMRAVFSHSLGQGALAEGWAPELLHQLRRYRKWPGSFETTKLREEGMTKARRLADIEMRLARDGEVNREETEFRQRRRAALERCASISAAGGVA